MEQKEFILAYVGEGTKPLADVALVRAQPAIEVLLDPEGESTMLVKAESSVIQSLLVRLPGWRAMENRRHQIKTRLGYGGKRAIAR